MTRSWWGVHVHRVTQRDKNERHTTNTATTTVITSILSRCGPKVNTVKSRRAVAYKK